MKEQNKNTGWFEAKQDVVTCKGIQKKSPRHYEVSRKKEYSGNVMVEPFAPVDMKEESELVIVKFEKNIETDKEFNKIMDDFFKEHPDAEYVCEKNKIKISKKFADAIKEFLIENEIDADIFTEDDNDGEDEDEVDDVIDAKHK